MSGSQRGESSGSAHDKLAAALAALASPARLELLELLRRAKTVPEIELRPRRFGAGGDRPASSAARQTVAHHVARLLEEDLVREERAYEGGRPSVRYAANASRLFEVLDGLRRVVVQMATSDPLEEGTRTLGEAVPAVTASGPRLVLARGVYEGKVFPLTEATAHEGEWRIGRRRGLPVCLDFDRFASAENCVLRPEGSRFSVTDYPSSKNGTFLNWGKLPPGEPCKLKAGDVLGVGRSLLVFAPD